MKAIKSKTLQFIYNIYHNAAGMIFIPTFLGFGILSLSEKVNGPAAPGEEWFMFDSWFPAILGSGLAVLGYTYAHAWAESKRNIKGQFKHWLRAAARFLVMSGIAWLILRVFPLPKMIEYLWQDLTSGEFLKTGFTFFSRLSRDEKVWVGLVVYYIGIFGVFFDPFYAATKGLPWDYLGTEATQDRIFRRNPWILLSLDISVFALGIYILSIST